MQRRSADTAWILKKTPQQQKCSNEAPWKHHTFIPVLEEGGRFHSCSKQQNPPVGSLPCPGCLPALAFAWPRRQQDLGRV